MQYNYLHRVLREFLLINSYRIFSIKYLYVDYIILIRPISIVGLFGNRGKSLHTAAKKKLLVEYQCWITNIFVK